MAASIVLIQQVPFSFSRYRSLAYILMSRYLLFKFALPFSLARTYKRLVQPYRGFLRLCRYSKTFLRTFITHMHIQSLPRSRGAATIAENWSLTERRFRHLEKNGTWQVPSQLSHSADGHASKLHVNDFPLADWMRKVIYARRKRFSSSGSSKNSHCWPNARQPRFEFSKYTAFVGRRHVAGHGRRHVRIVPLNWLWRSLREAL